jgi:hypothetical protein
LIFGLAVEFEIWSFIIISCIYSHIMASTLHQFEGERARRLSIDASHLAAEIGLQKQNRKESVRLFEGERERQVGEIENAQRISEENRAEVREGVKLAVEAERERRLSASLEGSVVEGLTRLNEALTSQFNKEKALQAFEQEQTRRIGETVFAEAAAKSERLNLLKNVVEAEERERLRVIATIAFYEAAALAESKSLAREILEAQDRLRTASIATAVFEEAAYLAERKRVRSELALAEEAERMDRISLEADSLLFKTVVDELSVFHETFEKLKNQRAAVEAMELERIRRVTIDEAYTALEEYSRNQSRKAAADALDVEKSRRIALAVFEDAASKAQVLQNRRTAAVLAEKERARRVLELSNTGYALV